MTEETAEKIKGRFKLKKLVGRLGAIKGRHTELVSVYVPANYSLHEIINQLRQEEGTAENIKSKGVRKNVTSSLDKIIRHLQLYKSTPLNGLAVFAGNVSEKEGEAVIELIAIEPPEPVKVKMYWCDQKFVVDPLADMVEEKEVYGIITVDRSEADVGLLVGKKIEPLIHMESIVPGKTRAGGQCLLPETLVQLSNGEEKCIKDVRIGDLLKSYDFQRKRFIETKCIDKWHLKKNKVVEIKVNGVHIVSSEEHTFFTKNGKKQAKELRKDDLLINKNAESVDLEYIKINNGEYNLIDISVENENFIANGLLVHNSSARFSRVREGLLNDWFKQFAEAVNKVFEGHKETIGIIVGGPGPVKELFLKEDYLHDVVKKKILGTVDTSYTGEYGLHETLERGKDLIKEASVLKEKIILQKFFEELQKQHGMAVYGFDNVVKATEQGASDTIIVSEKLNLEEVEYECDCGLKKKFVNSFEKNRQICETCNKHMKILGEKDLVVSMEELANNYGTKLEVVSADTREGQQFYELGGVAALLRYGI